MSFDLATIDWTAIGSIATAIALIFAYWSINISNKQNRDNRNLQILLLKREHEQKKLDDIVANILEINNGINPISILDFSAKMINKTFTTKDRQMIDTIANQDMVNNIKLNIQFTKSNNFPSANILLAHLNKIRENYGLWAKSINLLHLYANSQNELTKLEQENAIKNLTFEMSEKCKEIDFRYESIIADIYRQKTDIFLIALNVMTIFESEMASQIQNQKKIFERELYEFIKKEQERIDKIIS